MSGTRTLTRSPAHVIILSHFVTHLQPVIPVHWHPFMCVVFMWHWHNIWWANGYISSIGVISAHKNSCYAHWTISYLLDSASALFPVQSHLQRFGRLPWKGLQTKSNRETRGTEELLAEDNSCTAHKSNLRMSSLAISSWLIIYWHAQQICGVVIAMHYPERRVKGRIANSRQCSIITASPEEHGRVKLARRTSWRTACRQRPRQETKEFIQVKFRCPFYTISLHNK